MTNPDPVERDDSFINVLASLPADEQATVLFDFATDTAYIDDEPRDVHTDWCPIWQSPDPVDDCDCGSFQAGVEHKVALFESHGAGGAA